MKLTRLLPVCAALAAIAPLPAFAQSKIQTNPAMYETIVVPVTRIVELQSVPVLPVYFTLPMDVRVSSMSSITTDHPITDRFQIVAFKDYTTDSTQNLDDIPPHQQQYSSAVTAWAEQLRECLKEKPKLYRLTSKGDEIPVMLSSTMGKVVLNANSKSVCPI